MKIGLFGFTLSHENMGCQALTCSFLELIRKNCDSVPIEIVAFRNENCLGVIPDLFPEMIFRIVKVSLHNNFIQLIKEIKKCDIIFDETFGDGFSDIYFTKSVYRDTIVKCIVSKLNVPFVMTPQTYGPFKRKSLELLAAYAIRNADKVYARDQLAAEYAQKISKRSVEAFTDMAFALPYNELIFDSNKLHFGLNVSGLLWQGGFHKENQFGLRANYQDFCKSLIEKMLEKGAVVHIIPHVTQSADPLRVIPDGDYPVCIQLKNEYPEAVLAPCFSSPYEAKNYIAGMDWFVGARMHSTIGAVSAGVKTIAFAYSKKFQGLFESIEYPYYIDGTKLSTADALNLTFDIMKNDVKLNRDLIRCKAKIDDLNSKFEDSIVNIFENITLY